MRFLRVAPRGIARHFVAKGIHRVYRYSSRPRTWSKLNRYRGGVILPRRKREEVLQQRPGVLASRLRGMKSPSRRVEMRLSMIVARLTLAASERIANQETSGSLYKSPRNEKCSQQPNKAARFISSDIKALNVELRFSGNFALHPQIRLAMLSSRRAAMDTSHKGFDQDNCR